MNEKLNKERYENIMKNVMMGTYIKGEETYNFNFGTDLKIVDKQKFVNSVVGLLVNDNSYNSVLRDLIFDFYIIDILTDIDTTELKESSFFVNDVEQFLEETNIIDIVKANAEIGLFDELNKAIDNSIAYLTGIHLNPLNEALASLVNTLEKKINEADLGTMMNVAKKFAGMTGDITPKSIVDAYMTSDVHKKNLDEIEESKKLRAEFANDMDKAIKSVVEE